ncbi:ribosomal protein L6, alpha-beta domain-containing protein [Parasitella parasitica]|nr:ribosomal protein L6, alpha-beta domain-containing protein [Parasitella parasitica]
MNSLRLSSGAKSLNRLSLFTSRQFHQGAPVLSHIGRQPIPYANDIRIEHDMTPITEPRIPSEFNNTTLTVSGPLGKLHLPIKPFVKINLIPAPRDDPNAENILQVSVQDDGIKQQKAMWGTTRALINNAILGVSDGYKVYLRLVGVGYRGMLENNDRVLSLKLGYSHPIQMDLPEGVTCSVPAPNRIILRGINLQHVTEFAAKVQRWRMPEPYNQKGIFINDETIKKKEGKKK